MLFENEHYQVSVSIGLNSFQFRSDVCVCNPGPGPSIVSADVLDPTWLDSIRQRDLLDIRSSSDTKLKMSGSIAHPLCIDESRHPVSFGVVRDLVVLVPIATKNIDRSIKSIRPTE